MPRELRISEEVAELLPASTIAQLEAVVDDADNVCCACGATVAGQVAEAVVFADDDGLIVKLAHPDCMASAVIRAPGVSAAFRERLAAEDGQVMATLLGLRRSAPRPLIFLEPELLVSGLGEDPLGAYAEALGLAPVSGTIESIAPPATEKFTVVRIDGGIGLETGWAVEEVPADAAALGEWLGAAAGEALVVIGRGLALRREPPTIEEALALRPCWAGVATIAFEEA